jgi:hypothetical protein
VALEPPASIGVGLATAGLVLAIHSQATPSMADIRVAAPNDDHIDTSERAASWLSVGIVAGVSLLAKDPTIFIIGGATVVAIAWWTRYGNAVNPLTGMASMEGAVQRLDLTAVAEEAEEANFDTADAAGF